MLRYSSDSRPAPFTSWIAWRWAIELSDPSSDFILRGEKHTSSARLALNLQLFAHRQSFLSFSGRLYGFGVPLRGLRLLDGNAYKRLRQISLLFTFCIFRLGYFSYNRISMISKQVQQLKIRPLDAI